MFVPRHRQAAVGNDPITLFLELKAIVNVQVAVEPKALVHQPHLADGFPPKGHTVRLHRIGFPPRHFLMEVLHIVGSQPIGAENAHRFIGKLAGNGAQHIADNFGRGVEDDDMLAPAEFQADILAGGVADNMVAVDDPEVGPAGLMFLQPVGGVIGGAVVDDDNLRRITLGKGFNGGYAAADVVGVVVGIEDKGKGIGIRSVQRGLHFPGGGNPVPAFLQSFQRRLGPDAGSPRRILHHITAGQQFRPQRIGARIIHGSPQFPAAAGGGGYAGRQGISRRHLAQIQPEHPVKIQQQG